MMRYWRRALESAVIVLGLSAFWPEILGYESTWYKGFLALVAVALALLAAVRFRRVKREFEHPETPDGRNQVKWEQK